MPNVFNERELFIPNLKIKQFNKTRMSNALIAFIFLWTEAIIPSSILISCRKTGGAIF